VEEALVAQANMARTEAARAATRRRGEETLARRLLGRGWLAVPPEHAAKVAELLDSYGLTRRCGVRYTPPG
jgi:hypothetical protein